MIKFIMKILNWFFPSKTKDTENEDAINEISRINTDARDAKRMHDEPNKFRD